MEGAERFGGYLRDKGKEEMRNAIRNFNHAHWFAVTFFAAVGFAGVFYLSLAFVLSVLSSLIG